MPPPHSAIATCVVVGLSAPAFVSGQGLATKSSATIPHAGIVVERTFRKLRIILLICTSDLESDQGQSTKSSTTIPNAGILPLI
jgi:hypothetical protein